jgi:hypothetical protein
MWISQAAYLKDKEDSIQLRTERDLAVTQLKQQETTLAWFMHRLTQIEQERARLIFNYTGVKVDAPAYEPEDPEKNAASMLNKNPLNSLPNFGDVGDEEARRLGITWDDEGNVLYNVTK